LKGGKANENKSIDVEVKPSVNTQAAWLNYIRRFRPWLGQNVFGLFREMRASYIPPLMVYLAAGVSGFTGIIESFYVKEELGLSAAFLASLGFWAGLPWALKMPLGHLVDLYWRRKSLFVYLGAVLMAASLLIMVGLTGYKDWMGGMLPLSIWYIISTMLAPVGFILQDVVADAMTVEAVPGFRADGTPLPEDELKRMHVTVQTLGRVAILGGSAVVAGLGGWLARTLSYAAMYWISLIIPVISVMGVFLGSWMLRHRRGQLRQQGLSEDEVLKMTRTAEPSLTPNYYILGGSGFFAVMTLVVGLSNLPLKAEIIFGASLVIIAYLIHQLVRDLATEKRREIIGIAVIIFVFRAMPTAGAGASWWQIDVLQFDEAFFGTLRQVSAILAIIGMIALRAWMSRRPIPYLVVFLSVYSTVMFLPFLGMYYGLHQWTAENLGFGARTIAIVDTMADSPLGQVAMIPMLAWIAQEAPRNQKATYFAVMAAFTNLALSASHLGTKYLNKIFVIERGQYGELGMLMISVALIGLIVPLATVLLVNPASKQGPQSQKKDLVAGTY
jgi:hypothetical protein